MCLVRPGSHFLLAGVLLPWSPHSRARKDLCCWDGRCGGRVHANVPERRLRRRRQSTPRAVATPFRRSSSAGREAGERAKKKKIPITVVDGVYYTRVAVGVTTIAFKLKLFRSDSSSDGLPPPMKALQNALGPAYLASYARCAAICTPPNSYEMRAGHSSLWSGVLWRAATTKRGWTAPKQLYKMRLREMPFRKCCMI